MDTEKLTTMSRDAVSAALRLALTNGNPTAEPVHLHQLAAIGFEHDDVGRGAGLELVKHGETSEISFSWCNAPPAHETGAAQPSRRRARAAALN